MNRIELHTSYGPLAFVGHVWLGAPRPTLLMVSGAYPPRDYKHDLNDRFPGANVLLGGLPGMFSAAFQDASPEIISAAYDEVIGLLLPGQPIVAYGISTGCLVTAGLKSPIRRHVLQEPFLATGGLWPFIADVRARLQRDDNAAQQRFARQVFGYDLTTVEDRDYSHLFDGLDVPTDVLVGEIPLEVEDARVWPSFMSTEDRRRLARNPNVRMQEGPRGSGHHLEASPEAEALVIRTLHQALLSLVEPAP